MRARTIQARYGEMSRRSAPRKQRREGGQRTASARLMGELRLAPSPRNGEHVVVSVEARVTMGTARDSLPFHLSS
jgi:hypothetical protein